VAVGLPFLYLCLLITVSFSSISKPEYATVFLRGRLDAIYLQMTCINILSFNLWMPSKGLGNSFYLSIMLMSSSSFSSVVTVDFID